MDATTLLLLTSSVGVGFGWQPMPDGSPRVEYLVQIEPELLTSLQAGMNIPIVSDVPKGIGPIGRVRIVIGRAALPHQKLSMPVETTRRKPNSGASGSRNTTTLPFSIQQDSAVQRAQFSTPALPPSGRQPSQPTSPSRPGQNMPAPALPGSPSAGNRYQQAIEAGERRAAAAQAAAVQAAAAQGSEIQAQFNGQRQQLADQLRQALPATPITPGSKEPEGGAGTAKAAPGWPNSHSQVPAPRSPANGNPQTLSSQSGPSVGASGSKSTTSRTAISGNQSPYPPPPTDTPGTFPGQRLDQPVPAGPVSAGSDSAGPVTAGPVSARSSPARLSGPAGTSPAAIGFPSVQRLSPPGGKVNHWSSQSFDTSQPIARTRTAADSNRQARQNVSGTERNRSRNAQDGPQFPRPKQNPQPPNGTPLASTPPMSHSPTAKAPADRAQASHGPITPKPAVKSKYTPPQSGNSPGMFSLLLAWVLLCGSVAGNLYLFWSYLDIRGKYQAMIHTNRGPQRQFSRAG